MILFKNAVVTEAIGAEMRRVTTRKSSVVTAPSQAIIKFISKTGERTLGTAKRDGAA